MKIQNVHDKFFKETFSRIDVVTNFLEELVDEKLVKKLDLSTLKSIIILSLMKNWKNVLPIFFILVIMQVEVKFKLLCFLNIKVTKKIMLIGN